MTGRDWTTLGWFRVAVQSLVVLAGKKDESCSSALIAEGLAAHAVFLRRVLAQLVRANLVAAREGRDGGYRLARPADQITLADVFCAIHHVADAEAADPPVPVGSDEFDSTGVAQALDAVGQEVEQQALSVFARHTIASLVTQLARAKGARVIGTASAVNQDFVRSLGGEAIDHDAAPFETLVHDVDVVIDTVGGEVLQRSWQVLKPGGLLVSVAGRATEEEAKARGRQFKGAGRVPASNLAAIAEMITAGKLTPAIQATFPLSQAVAAQQLCETGHGRGRIILLIN